MMPIVPDLVSTIIPVYNRPVMLRKAVQCVLDQSYRPVEVVIANDGSTDGETARVGQELAAAYPGQVFFLTQKNAGPGPARNLGLTQARGEFVQYLDSDDLLLPTKFAQQVAHFRAHTDCGVSYCLTRRINHLGELRISHRTEENFDSILPHCLLHRLWHTVSPLWRRDAVERIGPWCDLRVMEDWDYDIRAGVLGVKPGYIPQFLCEIRDHLEERASFTTVNHPEALWIDWLRAYQRIYEHVENAGLTEQLRTVRFANDLFRVARMFALNERVELSRQACRLTRKVPASLALRCKVSAFECFARVIGWKRAAVLLEAVWQRVGPRQLPLKRAEAAGQCTRNGPSPTVVQRP